MTNAILVAPRGRAVRPGFTIRLRVLACLVALALSVLIASALTRVVPGQSLGAGRLTSVANPVVPLPVALLTIPAAAQAPVSAALGRDDSGYRVAAMSITNPEQRLSARFAIAGADITAGAVRFTLGLTGVGRGTQVQPVTPVEPRLVGQVVRYDYPGTASESWQNGPLGLEQVFVATHRPAGAGALTFAMAAPAGSRMDAGDVLLPGGLRYDGLRVNDARGRVLHSWLSIEHGSLLIKVSDRGAQYPLTVDPLVQKAYQTPSDGKAGDLAGSTVGISGDTVVIGAPAHEEADVNAEGGAGTGAVYVFSDSSGTWKQTAELTPTAPSRLGTSVAVSGNTIVASAPDAGTDNQGELCVYSDSSGSWKQVAVLTASDAAVGEALGEDPQSVAISGNKIFAGAQNHADGTHTGQGAVYVFHAGAGGWHSETQSAELIETHGATDDAFGYSVAISGNTLVTGATAPFPQFGHQSSVFVFTESGNHWKQTAELKAKQIRDTTPLDSLGYAVAISGDTVAAPEQGGNPLIVFQKSGGKWKQSADLTYHPICESTECSGTSDATSVTFLGGAILSSVADDTANGSKPAAAIAAYREFAGKWRQVAAIAAVTGANAGIGTLAHSGSAVALGVYNATDAGGVEISTGKITEVGNLIAGPVGVAGYDLDVPVLCVLTSNCEVTVTGYRSGTQTVIGAGKAAITIKPGGTKEAVMVFNRAGEHLLGTHKLKATLVVRVYSKGKLRASGRASANLTAG